MEKIYKIWLYIIMWDTKTLKKTFNLNKLYQELNQKYFDGVLGECVFYVVPDPCSFMPAAATILPHKKRTGGYTADIKFNSRIDWNSKDVRRVLLHEMIHYYTYVKTGRCLAFPHGLRFIIKMIKINIMYNEHIRLYWYKEKLTWSNNQPR